jgi:drug/metabolite transporter (DMT)-like permease
VAADPAAVIQSLIAACLFALGIQFLNLGLRHADSRIGTLIDIGASAAFYWLLSPLFLKLEYWLTPAALIFAAVGVFRPVLSANLALAGVHRLGPTLASALTSTGPLFAAVFGVVLLGEALTAPIILGTLAVVLGTMIQTGGKGAGRDWPLWAIALPLAASCLRSLSHVLIRIGLAFAPEPLFAGLVAYTVSFLVAVTAEGRRSKKRVDWRSPGLAWFAVAGVTHGLAVWSMNAALQKAPVTIVVPLVSAAPVVTLLLGLVVFRRETITMRKGAMVALVFAGVALIAGSG